jgi:hypothetical protein
VSLSVVVARLEDDDVMAFSHIYQSVLFVDPARPTTGQHVSKRFGFSDSFKWRAHRFFEKAIEAYKQGLVVGLPIEIVLPPKRSEYESHYESLWTLRSPAFA